ncbi:hypothetical protein Goshw_012983 [Gossypium schwendimanii]|uniref:Uncharacterized protein n=1 Tax=Gossypium schwendimanii TaxID=34291 RepID=A0A7J9MBV5_GOSSC|nr:hypothetical protein [Gossypium schwendimanii]
MINQKFNAVAHLLATEGSTKGDQSLMRNGISEYAKEEVESDRKGIMLMD